MSIHKLTAGSGYDYLTRQVAVLDATEKGHTGLASYYAERGETPGQWIGAGVDALGGLAVGDVVTAEQMQSLFGSGHHPLAQERTAAPTGSRMVGDVQPVIRLGAPFKVYDGDVSAFRVEVAKRLVAVNQADGLPGDWPVPADDRARVRTEVAHAMFVAEHGRQADGARELAATIAKHSTPKTTAVAGYDLCFSPVKSVSTLWAVADRAVAAQVELAHQAAVQDALKFLEDRALFTRTGTNGVRQVDVTGMVATAFTHRDSRAGDPDLHTHVAVANKVLTEDGRWLSIDGRILFKATVAASETYNTALEKRLGDRLGLRFAERDPGSGSAEPSKRPVREVVGIDPALNERWSARRASIEVRRAELATRFQASHGRPPTPIESVQLAQQATLETRQAKHEPRTLAEQRTAWRADAIAVLGGDRGVDDMVAAALAPGPGTAPAVDADWVRGTADRILTTMQERRATWQVWHVRAEAHRQVRAAAVTTGKVDQVVDLLVDEVLTGRSISMARPTRTHLAGADVVDDVPELVQLRRSDGTSVYTVAGADLYTSTAILEAEQRLVRAAGRLDGRTVPEATVELALLEAAANGVELNAGQAALVRQMATSGARVQLAIAPAGSGKTTAMRALAAAWESEGGQVVGLAPSAAAAAALRDQIDTPAGTREDAGDHDRGCGPDGQVDTLAKLTWSLRTGDLPGWANQIGPQTLVLIDEAGMADTMSLDFVVQHVVDRGGSVRLVGDDQQLAAIGAGGVLRDIQSQYGAAHLTELMRFADPAEGAATLALREGRPEALGYYLDHDRIHVGDLTTNTDEVFRNWRADRGRGLDTIMLAPTRDLVRELNQRARNDRLTVQHNPEGHPVGATSRRHDAAEGRGHGGPSTPPAVRLADGNDASVGELVTTRSNNRRLRTSATDWVKNGDRWTVLDLHQDGSLTVQHTRHGRTVDLPADYVAQSTELGYASTIHTAQGVSVDTMHGLATGQESRQLLYTMLTRGRLANHLHLEVVGDGDPHSVIHPYATHPRTPTQILEQVLARDESPTSTTTQMRELADPAKRLGDSAARYLDALYVAAEDVTGTDVAAGLDVSAQALGPALVDQPAWPALRSHLLLIGAAGEDPVAALQAAAQQREVDSTGDLAAVLDWRMDSTGLRNAGPGPLPWMPAVPAQVHLHPTWGPYLKQRADLVVDLAAHVRQRATNPTQAAPAWARQLAHMPDPDVIGDVEVWRAATAVPATDHRPTGHRQLQKSTATWQRRLDRRVTGGRTPAVKEWGPALHALAAGTRRDPFTAILAERLAALSRAGLPARELLNQAVAGHGPLPDDHAAAALWWRLSRSLTPDVAAVVDDPHRPTSTWTPRLVNLLGPERADRVRTSPYWPALVTVVDHGQARGWVVDELLQASMPTRHLHDVDECQAIVWRASILTDPAARHLERPSTTTSDLHEDIEDPDQAPPDLLVGAETPSDAPTPTELDEHYRSRDAQDHRHDPQHHDQDAPRDLAVGAPGVVQEPHVDRQAPVSLHSAYVPGLPLGKHWAALARDTAGPAEVDPASIERDLRRDIDWHESGHTRARLARVNELAAAFYESAYPGSWGHRHLIERLGVDIAGDPRFRAGHAPAGWTHLVDHLRGHGISNDEMLAAGVATAASTGRLIDRFRDRVVLPFTTADGSVLGFVGRRHPDRTDTDNAGPKYLNTAATVLFHKGAQLYVAGRRHLDEGATPVRVEGPLDAIAVTLATGGTHVGAAPLGTSLTDEQAGELAAMTASSGHRPVVATDADVAGALAAERDYWVLAQHRLDPGYARLPLDTDPADILTTRGPDALAAALRAAGGRALAEALIDERLSNLPVDQALAQAAAIAAARPPTSWDHDTGIIAARLWTSHDSAAQALLTAAAAWTRDPRHAARHQIQQLPAVRERLTAAVACPPEQRWRALAARTDPRLPHQDDWPALACLLQTIHDDGRHLPAVLDDVTAHQPLNDQPAQDLRSRLTAHPTGTQQAQHPPQRILVTPELRDGVAVVERRRAHQQRTPTSDDRRDRPQPGR